MDPSEKISFIEIVGSALLHSLITPECFVHECNILLDWSRVQTVDQNTDKLSPVN
jgi:hypothetical protein